MLFDSADRSIGYLTFDLVAGETKGPIVLKVEPNVGRRFRCGTSSSVTFKARLNGTADPYVDLAGAGIDLSGFTPGVLKSYDVICVADSGVTGLVRVPLALVVSLNKAAGWAS